MTERKAHRERLVHYVQLLEGLTAEKDQAAEALRDAFRNAKMAGFDVHTLRVVLRLRKMSPSERREKRALEAIYMAALGMLEGDPLPDEARRRLDEGDEHGSPEPSPPGAAPPSADGPDPDPAPKPPPQMSMPLKDPEEARAEGREAAEAGKRIYDNPYPAGDPCRAAWDEGWCAASGSHGMDTPSAYQRRKKKPPDDADSDSEDSPEETNE